MATKKKKTRYASKGSVTGGSGDLTAYTLRRLMDSHGVTIPQLAKRLKVSQARVKEAMRRGVHGKVAADDWYEAVAGKRPWFSKNKATRKPRAPRAPKRRPRAPRKPKRNPAGVVIGEAAEKLYYRGGKGKPRSSRWVHKFETPVEVLGLDDGSVLLRSKRGLRLWEDFDVETK